MNEAPAPDGIHALPPREKMIEPARKLRDIYDITPGAPFVRREFGYMEGVRARWESEGLSPDPHYWHPDFLLEPGGNHSLGQLGWCESAFVPMFKEVVLEDRGDHELARDRAGRHVLYFKGRRNGFMPEYVDHPVKDWKTWEEDVKPRLDPKSPERYADFETRMTHAKEEAAKGMRIVQGLIGGYMYLRSLIGPEGALYFFYDQPDLVRDCMKTWFELADAVIARHQQHVTLDEIFFAEDICYNGGPLISPAMMREFLLPLYKQLIDNARTRQIDRARRLFVHVDTDGWCVPVIDVYREGIGMDVMSPFEVASGCDVVDVGKRWPDLVIFGGIDKRVLAKTKRDIDEHLEYILPAMRARGGYIPTSDHAVPLEVPLENYLYYRRRCVELGG